MTERPKLITAFTDERPFAASSNATLYRHPRRASLWRAIIGALSWK